MSRFAPPSQNGESPLKFGIFDIQAVEKVASTGNAYFEFEYIITPYEPTEQIKKRKFFSFSEEYRKIIWPSLTGIVPNPDEVITEAGNPPHYFYASYRTPKYLLPMSAKDLEYAKANNRMGDIETDSIGRPCKKSYPVKFEKLFASQEEWRAAAEAHKAEQPAPAQPAPESNPEYAAVLAMLPIFVNNSGLDLKKLEVSLSNPPFNTLGIGLQSKEVKLEVAKAIVTRHGRNLDAIKGVLLDMNGYLDIEGAEIKSQLEEVAF